MTAAVLRAKIRDVFGHLPRALAGNEDAVHEMRIAGRRLRVALPLLAQKPDGRRVRRALAGIKAMTRAAGASRDLDVMLACVEDEKVTSPVPPTLRARMRAARRRGRVRMTELLLDVDIAGLRRDLRAITARGCDSPLLALARIRAAQTAEARELRAMLVALGESYEPEALHRLRIGVRRLRYMADLDGELGARDARAGEILKDLQDELGRIRDLHLVAQWFEEAAARSHARGAVRDCIEAQAQDLRFRNRSREAHRRFLAAAPSARIEEALRRLGHRTPAA
jgi:CHAD domain-containing protein